MGLLFCQIPIFQILHSALPLQKTYPKYDYAIFGERMKMCVTFNKQVHIPG